MNTKRARSVDVAPVSAMNASSPSSARSITSESPRAMALAEPETWPRNAVDVTALASAPMCAESTMSCASSHDVAVSLAMRAEPRTWETCAALAVWMSSMLSKRRLSIGPFTLTRPRTKPSIESARAKAAPAICTSSESATTSSGRRRIGDDTRSSMPPTVISERDPPMRRSSYSSLDGLKRHAESGPPGATRRPRSTPSHGAGGIVESPMISRMSARSIGASVTSTSRMATPSPTSATKRPVSRESAVEASMLSMA